MGSGNDDIGGARTGLQGTNVRDSVQLKAQNALTVTKLLADATETETKNKRQRKDPGILADVLEDDDDGRT